jgi:antitoxin ParD1/3/4
MATRKTRNVSLTPELDRSIEEMIASGRYRSASEVIRAALRFLEKEEGKIRPRKPNPRLRRE